MTLVFRVYGSLALPTQFSLGLFQGLTSPGERDVTPEKGQARIRSANARLGLWSKQGY